MREHSGTHFKAMSNVCAIALHRMKLSLAQFYGPALWVTAEVLGVRAHWPLAQRRLFGQSVQ
jgi:hypothetical protein